MVDGLGSEAEILSSSIADAEEMERASLFFPNESKLYHCNIIYQLNKQQILNNHVRKN
jgi:hypothetical protein